MFYKFNPYILEKYAECLFNNRLYNLVFNNAELDRFLSQYEKLGDQIYIIKI